MNPSSALWRHDGDLPRAGQAADAHASRARQPMLIEFLGTPGSGKTTICAAAVSELSRDGFAIITRDDYFGWMRGARYKKIEYILAGGYKTWYFAAYLFCFLFRCSTLHGHTLIKATYELVCMQAWLSRVVCRTEPCAIVLDEFACNRFVYRLHDAPLTALAKSNLVHLLFLFYPSCDVHWILKTVSVKMAAQRISLRPTLNNRMRKPIELLPAARARATLIQHMQLSRFMFEAVQSRFADNAHVVDGAEPVDAQVRDTRDLLVRLLRDGRVAEHANL